MHDRTMKLLLFAIALALWGFLLRPVFAPEPAQAQGGVSVAADGGRLILATDALYLYHQDGNVYKFDLNLRLQQRALRQFEPVRASPFESVNRTTFVTLGP